MEYRSKLGLLDTEIAIKKTKDFFERELALELSLIRVSAPIFVRPESGLNDNLNGTERPVSFKVKAGDTVEIVHSLAKWKRMALYRYGIETYNGLYTDMNAIRKDEEPDATHSYYVDQWDWEKIIKKQDRNEQTLKQVVEGIYSVMKKTERYLRTQYPTLSKKLPEQITFVTTQELEDQYPDLTPKERENAIAKTYGAVFLMQIGGVLASGQKHDGRAPDYDDWQLNGDIIVWFEPLQMALELSSMGIRVDAQSLEKQLEISSLQERKSLPFHQMVLHQELPYTIGGGIGQSRLCMFFLEKIHIGEVQASIWPETIQKQCEASNINLL